MEDLVNRRCEQCKRQPRFAAADEKPRFCLEHKRPDDIDHVTRKCAYIGGCSKVPTYGLPNTKKSEYCDEHKPNGYVDVKHMKCKGPECKSRPTYGLEGGKAEY